MNPMAAASLPDVLNWPANLQSIQNHHSVFPEAANISNSSDAYAMMMPSASANAAFETFMANSFQNNTNNNNLNANNANLNDDTSPYDDSETFAALQQQYSVPDEYDALGGSQNSAVSQQTASAGSYYDLPQLRFGANNEESQTPNDLENDFDALAASFGLPSAQQAGSPEFDSMYAPFLPPNVGAPGQSQPGGQGQEQPPGQQSLAAPSMGRTRLDLFQLLPSEHDCEHKCHIPFQFKSVGLRQRWRGRGSDVRFPGYVECCGRPEQCILSGCKRGAVRCERADGARHASTTGAGVVSGHGGGGGRRCPGVFITGVVARFCCVAGACAYLLAGSGAGSAASGLGFPANIADPVRRRERAGIRAFDGVTVPMNTFSSLGTGSSVSVGGRSSSLETGLGGRESLQRRRSHEDQTLSPPSSFEFDNAIIPKQEPQDLDDGNSQTPFPASAPLHAPRPSLSAAATTSWSSPTIKTEPASSLMGMGMGLGYGGGAIPFPDPFSTYRRTSPTNSESGMSFPSAAASPPSDYNGSNAGDGSRQYFSPPPGPPPGKRFEALGLGALGAARWSTM